MRRTAFAIAVGLLASACTNDPTRASFSENVGAAFAECNPAEIRFLAGKHNFMTAFEPCGSNNFQHYSWSPNGTHLYFQLTHTGLIMDAEAEDKRTITVPTETPVGPAAWLNTARIAVPVGPAEGETTLRMAVFDKDQATLLHHAIPGLEQIESLQVGSSPSQLLFTALRDGKRHIFAMDLDDGTVSEPFPWAAAFEVTTFTYTPGADAVVIGGEGKATLYDAATGSERGTWAPAKRGQLHPAGRWLALEHDGEAVSIFYQRSWDELSEHARARELARAKAFEERLPDWYPKEVNPPTITLVDLQTGTRWMFTGFQGHQFEWYPARDYYASYILWGFEGKELNRNVMLGNLADRMRSMERGEEMLGVQRWRVEEDAAETPDAEEGAAPAEAVPGAGEEPPAQPAPGTEELPPVKLD
jgi:hypothetical protein